MATRQLVSTTGLASSTGAQDYLLAEAQDYSRLTVFAVGLAGGETLTAYIVGPNGVDVIATTEAGVDAIATASAPSMVLVGGPAYLLSKTATAAAGSAYFSPCTAL